MWALVTRKWRCGFENSNPLVPPNLLIIFFFCFIGVFDGFRGQHEIVYFRIFAAGVSDQYWERKTDMKGRKPVVTSSQIVSIENLSFHYTNRLNLASNSASICYGWR